MFKTRTEVPPQVMHILAGETFHERAERKLILLASPIFHPAKACGGAAAVDDRHLREQNGIVAERSENELIDCVHSSSHFFAKITDAENAIECCRVSRIQSAIYRLAVGKVPKPARKLAALR